MTCGIYKLLIRTLTQENIKFTLTIEKILGNSQN